MSDFSFPPPESENQTPPPPRQGGRGWIGGLVLIIIGMVFLFQNLFGYSFANWWALFLLLPAAASFQKAWDTYQEVNRFSRQVRTETLGGFLLILLAAIFGLGLDMGVFWPLLLILLGVGILINTILPD